MDFLKNKKTRALILTMCALVFSAIIVSYFYYKSKNESVDPRIVDARKLYEQYNALAQNNAFDSIFGLMDSIEWIYTKYDHYKNSYEVGVLYNNRAASFLTQALFTSDMDTLVQISLIEKAKIASNESINIYQNWLKKYDNADKEEIKRIASQNFFIGLDIYDEDQKNKFMSNRVDEIHDAQSETKRRLSVAYTNLGIVFRYQLQYEEAAKYYKKAVDLWDRNLTAENNLNILLGRPIKKRSFIQRLFPPKKDEN